MPAPSCVETEEWINAVLTCSLRRNSLNNRNSFPIRYNRAMRRIVVVGAGASGLLAAGRADELGAEVFLLEKMKSPGLKLRITGKGQCNLTNTAELDDFISRFGRNGRFLRSAFSSFFVRETMEFFEALGVSLEIQRGGRVFPSGMAAPGVVDKLVGWAQGRGVRLMTSNPVKSVCQENHVASGVVTRNGEVINSDAVILCMGGSSYPGTGSNGDGIRIAGKLGHTITDIRPALVPLETDPGICGRAAGLQLVNVGVNLFIEGRKKREEFGELLFMEFGVSGPTVLRLSGDVVRALGSGKKVELSIDLKPGLNEGKLDSRLLRDLRDRGREPVSSILRGLLPREMISLCLDTLRIEPSLPGNQVSSPQRKLLKNWLKDFRLEITGARPLREAIVTAGGVSLKQINPETMESRIIRKLFITGEMLDLDADTGGFNLQAAFSTGWLAGEMAARDNSGS